MIFEFFKRLFWKADEESKKRKINTDLQNASDSEPLKKHCNNFISNNRIQISAKSNEMLSKKRSQPCLHNIYRKKSNKEDDFEVVNINTPIDLIQTDKKHWKLSKNISPSEIFNHFTLTKTKKLSEKTQYNKMLLNFIPPDSIVISNMDETKIENKTLGCDTVLQSNKNTMIKSPVLHSFEFNKTSNYDSCYLQETTNTNIPISKFQKRNEKNKNLLPKIFKSNSLREVFSTKEVTKANFISEIAKKYNDRLEQQYKEVQEVKKITYLLSRHIQFTREAVLENYLNKSFKLCEVVLDEREADLPELSSEMIQKVKCALSKGPVDEILVQSFGLRIARRDIQTLAGLNWLNDEIINFYMNLLIMRGSNQGFPSVYAMNTFFYPKLLSGGHASLKRWTRKIDIFSKDLIVIPIHLGIHWCLAVVDFRKKTIKYYDSMGSPNNKCLQALKQYLIDECNDKKQISFDFSDWIFECEKNIPQQMNGSDCGVFSCMFAEYICADKNINFSQDDMPYFRNKMIYEIINIKLL